MSRTTDEHMPLAVRPAIINVTPTTPNERKAWIRAANFIRNYPSEVAANFDNAKAKGRTVPLGAYEWFIASLNGKAHLGRAAHGHHFGYNVTAYTKCGRAMAVLRSPSAHHQRCKVCARRSITT